MPDDPKAVVTDSAAAASAWATGEKTYNGAISVDVDGNPLAALGRQAKAAGKATGLVTTAQVTDASPAAFLANTANRSAQDEIARQYIEVSKPDVILGGGEDWWLPAGSPGASRTSPPRTAPRWRTTGAPPATPVWTFP
ncbi:alkaline phosphatase [Streptomyces sp. NPDC086077]|uniref:alkaline phosphatase n=1 Tax=Streptomyces sp. NPDC086077 TaxID=3154862 RepID=UPI0034173065